MHRAIQRGVAPPLAVLPDEVLDAILGAIPAGRTAVAHLVAMGSVDAADGLVRLGELAAAVALEIERRLGVPAEWLLARIAEPPPEGDG